MDTDLDNTIWNLVRRLGHVYACLRACVRVLFVAIWAQILAPNQVHDSLIEAHMQGGIRKGFRRAGAELDLTTGTASSSSDRRGGIRQRPGSLAPIRTLRLDNPAC